MTKWKLSPKRKNTKWTEVIDKEITSQIFQNLTNTIKKNSEMQ